jgi:hypothetical protein
VKILCLFSTSIKDDATYEKFLSHHNLNYLWNVIYWDFSKKSFHFINILSKRNKRYTDFRVSWRVLGWEKNLLGSQRFRAQNTFWCRDLHLYSTTIAKTTIMWLPLFPPGVPSLLTAVTRSEDTHSLCILPINHRIWLSWRIFCVFLFKITFAARIFPISSIESE